MSSALDTYALIIKQYMHTHIYFFSLRLVFKIRHSIEQNRYNIAVCSPRTQIGANIIQYKDILLYIDIRFLYSLCSHTQTHTPRLSLSLLFFYFSPRLSADCGIVNTSAASMRRRRTIRPLLLLGDVHTQHAAAMWDA